MELRYTYLLFSSSLMYMQKKDSIYFLFIVCCFLGTTAYGEYAHHGIMVNYDPLRGTCASGFILDTTILGTESCVSLNSYCYHYYGGNTAYDMQTDQCVCSYGSEWSENSTTGKTECQPCTVLHGTHSIYDISHQQCGCSSGYHLDKNGQCAAQNNIYFRLTGLDTDRNEAVIHNHDQSYYITYGMGCLSTTFSTYVLKNIMVTLGNRFNMDIEDKIVILPENNMPATIPDKVVLQNDHQSCEIMSIKKVNDNFVLRSS